MTLFYISHEREPIVICFKSVIVQVIDAVMKEILALEILKGFFIALFYVIVV